MMNPGDVIISIGSYKDWLTDDRKHFRMVQLWSQSLECRIRRISPTAPVTGRRGSCILQLEIFRRPNVTNMGLWWCSFLYYYWYPPSFHSPLQQTTSRERSMPIHCKGYAILSSSPYRMQRL